mmetsp:Transcript_39586/g.46064  ORF Transcript_39586/g.46064 Transcript_39586/m.46064 type:complete len:301 (-) Transcript_39586:131-1033(-)
MKSSMIFLLTLLGALASTSAYDSDKDMFGQFYESASLSLQQKEASMYGGLVTPQARSSSAFDTLSNSTCGGTSSDSVHFASSTGTPNRFQWYIHTPFQDSTCMIRLSQTTSPKDKDFVVLQPVDSGVVNKDGSFPCGRTGPTVESRLFAFPTNVSCDRCVIEWVWQTTRGQIRQCSDVSISFGNSSSTSKCPACQNGGVCSKNKCICASGYSGDLCQSSSGLASVSSGGFHYLWLIIILIVCIVLGLVAARIFKRKRDNGHNRSYEDFRRQGTDQQGHELQDRHHREEKQDFRQFEDDQH